VGALRTIVASLLATAALAAPVMLPQVAWAAEDDWPILKSHRVKDVPPWGAFVVYPSFGGPSVGVSLYMLRPENGPAVLNARRVRVRGDLAARIDWASAKTCPALPAALAKLEDLPPPRIDVPGVGREPREITVVADGSSYFLWSSLAAYSGGAIGELEVRTVDGTPAADWVDETLRALEPCWGSSEP
jgi:hypothetical protein